ncbi:hypothetical protein PR202_gb24507 [Eleusine coracana subsp. coracana]|uniref:Protein kish n=1 Tax=Eleusine coracana subsp. coracana TaxID=191504 RepID=A0AAV5FLN0_ELECO|nr:hypothetical protein PR202_gb24507 [Eleusine coracana subsp. coracana]
MSALFNFNSFLTVVLLVICTCTYIKTQFPAILNDRTGFRGFFWKAARIAWPKLQRWCELRPSRAGSTGSGGSLPSFCDVLLLMGGSVPMATSVVLGAAANVQDGVASAAAIGTKIILQRASRGPLGDAAQR